MFDLFDYCLKQAKGKTATDMPEQTHCLNVWPIFTDMDLEQNDNGQLQPSGNNPMMHGGWQPMMGGGAGGQGHYPFIFLQ